MTADLPVRRDRRRPRSATPAWVFLGCGLVALALYVAVPVSVELPMFLALPALCAAAVVVGARRNELPGRRGPWYALTAGMLCFLGGVVLRIVVPGAMAVPATGASFIPDVLVVPGYAFTAFFLMTILRRRRAREDHSAIADALLIGIAAGLATWAFLLGPQLGNSALNPAALGVAAFPMVDVAMLVVVAMLMFADGIRQAALWLVAVAICGMLVLDLDFALRESGSTLDDASLVVFDLFFLLAYVTMATAALHPSMRTLSDPQRVVTKNIGASRVAGITLVVVAPTALAYLVPAPTVWNAVVRVGLAVLLAVTIVNRIVRSQAAQAGAEAAALHRSTHDALTDLPNRELLAETIAQWCDQAVEEGLEISLLFLDLDRFKHINDTWGHHVGDELLLSVADRLRAMVRSEDLVCRIGGDEFVIAMASPSHSTLAQSLAQRLVEEFGRPFPLSVGDVIVTPSIGVARAAGATEALSLIRDADIAMYQAKDSGGNTYSVFHDSLRERVRTRVSLEQALRGALGRGELGVHYQPIVDPASGALDGFEALMRWTHPELGIVSPMDFIPIAEETGLIVESGAWLLAEAVDQLARWQRDRDPRLLPLHVSVNISPRQLREPGLVEVVRRALAEADLPPSALWLEITESVLLKDAAAALAVLNELRDLGVTLCIDDFGTGYASLSYVRELPSTVVKIDKSFVNGIGRNSGDEAIVVAVIAMAHALHQIVVAEGVETLAQRDWLHRHHCDLVQGWLYGAPRPAAAQNAWMNKTLEPLLPASP